MRNLLQMNYWTIGGFEGKKPAAEALDDIKAMGLDGLELTYGVGEFARGITEKQCRAIRAEADRRGVRVATVSPQFYWDKPLSDPRPAIRRESIAFTRELLRVAAWVGAEAVLVLPGVVAVPWDASRPVVPYAEVWKNATASIRACLNEAEKRGVTIALENVWSWFLTDPMAMKQFVDQFHSRRVGVYFDVANCLINGCPEHWIDLLGRRMAAVHFKNFQRQDSGGGLKGFTDDLLKGDVNWKAVMAALSRIKYKGPITAEMIPFDRTMPDMALARDTAAKLRRLAGRA